MQLKRFLSYFLVFLFCGLLSAQDQGWEIALGGLFQNSTEDLLETDNGDYLLLGRGRAAANPNSLKQSFLWRISPDGEIVWNQVYDNPNANSTDSPHLAKAVDGGYVIAGNRMDQNGNWELYLFKIEENGAIVWTSTESFDQEIIIHDIAPTVDNGYILTGSIASEMTAFKDVLLIKTNNNGVVVWSTTYPFEDTNNNDGGNAGYVVTSLPNGGYVITGRVNSNLNPNEELFLLGINDEASEVWRTSFGASPGVDMSITPDGGYVIATSDKLIKTDSEGNGEWEFGGGTNFRSISPTSDGGYIATGAMTLFGNTDVLLLKLDENGNETWSNNIGQVLLERGKSALQTQDGGYIVMGLTDSFGDQDTYLVKTNQDGYHFPNYLKGKVFIDSDEDCELDSLETTWSRRIVQAIKGDEVYYAISDMEGNYDLSLDTGFYELKLLLPNDYWISCENSYLIDLSNINDSLGFNLPAQKIIECPYLEVDISTPFLRRCFDNLYTVEYCNTGTITAQDARVEVTLDPFLTYINASIPLTSQNGHTLLFDIDSLGVNECGSFQINTYLNCDSTILGQTHCVSAHIFPDSLCSPINSAWSGASLKVDAQCTGDSIFFFIRNVGSEDMLNATNYIITEDVIMRDSNSNILLASEEMITIGFPSTGGTYRLEVVQVENHPGRSNPSVVVEGCVPDGDPFNIGFASVFSEDDGDPFISIDCQDNRGSFDPNDKQGFPKGLGEEHFIRKNIDLEYLIRFQNTGTDTAFTVAIKDTLSAFLDATTVRPGAGSHPYDFSINGQGILTFQFDNIMLPDSNINELASHGFVKFKVAQKADLPAGTVIYNDASIYFDFNAPILTNETMHTIEDSFIMVSIEKPFLPNTSIKAFPNPFRYETTIQITGLPNEELTLEVFDLQGRLLEIQKTRNQEFVLGRKNLNSGMYIYSIQKQGLLVGVGKFIVE